LAVIPTKVKGRQSEQVNTNKVVIKIYKVV